MTAMTTDSKGEYRFGYSREELERLGYQHRVWVEANRRLLDRARLAEGSTVVDLGCGPGYTTLDLARAVGCQRLLFGRETLEIRKVLEGRAEVAQQLGTELAIESLESHPGGKIEQKTETWKGFDCLHSAERRTKGLRSRAVAC